MRFLYLILLLSFTSYAFSQTEETCDCQKFKNGTFIIEDGASEDYTIIRKGRKQIEIGESSGFKGVFKVKWIDDCTYTLRLKKIIKNPANEVYSKSMVVTVRIISCSGNTYVHESSVNGVLRYTSTMVKVK